MVDSVKGMTSANIDTPEMGTCLAQQAKAFTQDRLPVGARPELAYDVERYDRYGRLLAVVTPRITAMSAS